MKHIHSIIVRLSPEKWETIGICRFNRSDCLTGMTNQPQHLTCDDKVTLFLLLNHSAVRLFFNLVRLDFITKNLSLQSCILVIVLQKKSTQSWGATSGSWRRPDECLKSQEKGSSAAQCNWIRYILVYSARFNAFLLGKLCNFLCFKYLQIAKES